MKHINFKAVFSDHSSQEKKRYSGYAAGLICIVLAILIAANLLVSLLPASIKNIDISDTSIYSIGDTTKELLGNLSSDVTFTIVAQPGNIDKRISRITEEYADRSGHISITTVDPVQQPTALSEYNTQENTIVVSCPDTGRSTSVSFDSIIQYDQYSYYYSGTYQETAFDGEGQLTSAIDYVTNGASKSIAILSGHNETALGSSVTDRLTKANFATATLNLLTDSIPEDCDLILINGPKTDLSEDELATLRQYMADGGRVMVLLASDCDTSLSRLEALLGDYGVTVANGYVADSSRCYRNNYYYIFPQLVTTGEVLSSVSSDDYALLCVAHGMTVAEKDGITAESFMTSSDSAAAVTTVGQQSGTYSLGVKATDSTTGGQLCVLACDSIIDSSVLTSFPSLINLDIFMDSVTSFFEDVSNISIAAKSLEAGYNTVTAPGVWGILFIAVIPVILLAGGFVVWLRRRKK